MKRRDSFVANSSSSSFLLVTVGNATLIDSGDRESCDDCNEVRLEIDFLIAELEAAKATGSTTVTFEYGGGYEG